MNRQWIKVVLLAGGITSAGALYLWGRGASKEVIARSPVDEGCPESSKQHTHDSVILKEFTEVNSEGIVYDERGFVQLKKAAGLFRATSFTVDSKVVGLCTGDFDEDGWDDFIGASDGGLELGYYRNLTFRNQEANRPDWDDPAYRTEPLFEAPYFLEEDCEGRHGHAAPPLCTRSGGGLTVSCADFNNDGHLDFFYARSTRLSTGDIFVSETNRADIFLGRGDGTFERRYQAIEDLQSLNYLSWSTDSTPFDYNGDAFADLIIGHSVSNDDSVVDVYLSDGDRLQPKLTRGKRLVDRNLGKRGALASTFADMNGDGHPDLVVSGPTERDVWIYDGLAGGGVVERPRVITSSFRGGATTIVSGDFSLDGKTDLIIAADNWNYEYDTIGGYSSYWKNDGSSQPFSTGVTQETTERNQPYYDFDIGAAFDYDHDPDGTKDVIIADGNHAVGYMILANRTINQYTECGEISSGVLELGDLEEEEMVVTGAKMRPRVDVPAGASVEFYMSNEEPANWFEAAPCVDDRNSYCVSFPKPVGRSVRWKAKLCSNRARTRTPILSGVQIAFDFTVSKIHYRAGVVVDDGVAYVGAFQQPGNRGHFYATNAALTKTYWDFAKKLDSAEDRDRRIYTSGSLGKSSIDFDVRNAESKMLLETLGVANSKQAEAIIAWQRSARFGLDTKSRLGSVETSTPAVVGAPSIPIWYPKADAKAKERMDEFIKEHRDRPKTVLFGSKDGALHAVYSDPTHMEAKKNGTEAWAFIPAHVAVGMLSDFTNGTATSYPDGSPTVGDVIFHDGTVHTVAIVAGGNGHRGVFALDITEPIDEESGKVRGPKPLWQIVPGGATAGEALSKPVIARVEVEGRELFYAILATGRASEDPKGREKGQRVIAVDISDGSIAWQFESECAVTSDIAIFETESEKEEGAKLDGFIDRAVWADACGNVYKVDPAVYIKEEYLVSKRMGEIYTGHEDPNGNAVYAMFSTLESKCTMGRERPIYGTIGVRADETGRVVLFFGTGGSEDADPSQQNAFFAVYADSGEVRGCAEGEAERGLIKGECEARVCEKFYGGVVVTSDQVLITKSFDPPIGTGTCEFGSSEVASFDLSTLKERFSTATKGATVSSLYGDGGAIYFATLAGEVVRIGKPRAQNAGDDTANGTGGGNAESGEPFDPSNAPLNVVGWREMQ